MLNPSDSEFRELAVTIRFLDASNQPVGEARGQIAQLQPGDSLPLKAALPKTAVRMQMYSLQWRAGRRNFGRLLGRTDHGSLGIFSTTRRTDTAMLM